MDMAALPRAAELASPGARNPRWHPGSAAALHSEIFAPAGEASGAGAALALALDGLRDGGSDARAQSGQGQSVQGQSVQGQSVQGQPGHSKPVQDKAVLWVQDDKARRLGGRPYRPGLPESLRHRLIHVAAKTPEDALFALEEGMRCRDLACVIGEVAGNPRALDFIAWRRLTLMAEKHGVPLFLVRLNATADLSSARMRWRMCSAPSAPPLWNQDAPGQAAWQAELFRARAHAPGEWILRDGKSFLAAERRASPASDHGDLVPGTGARSLAAL